MFSKILFIVLIALLIGCANENAAESEPIEFNKAGADCLANLPERLAVYADGQMSHQEIGLFWDCVGDAVSEYDRLTAGATEPDRYKPEHIARFLQKYFFKQISVNESFLDSLMEIKRVVLAGDTKTVTRAELQHLREFLTLLKEVFQELNPHIRVVLLKAENPTDEEISNAAAAVKSAGRRLASWLDSHSQSYSFSQLEAFLEVVGPYLAKDWKRYFDLLPPLKQILLSGSKQGIGGKEWKPLTRAVTEMHLGVMVLEYGRRHDINSVLVRVVLPSSILAVSEVLKQSTELHPNGTIPFTEWETFFSALEKAELLPEAFSADSMSLAFKWAVERLLRNGNPANGLAKPDLTKLQLAMQNWSGLLKDENTAVTEIFSAVLNASDPMQWDVKGRLEFAKEKPDEWTKSARSRMVWPFVLVNFVLESYVHEDVVEFSAEELMGIVADVLPVIQSFGWLNSTEPEIAVRLIREADMFTSAADGNQKLHINEAVRYLVFVASAYRAAQIWDEGAKPKCTGDANCVRDFAANLKNHAFSAMPLLEESFAKKSERELARYLIQAEETVLGEKVSEVYGIGSQLQVYMLLQYIETFMARFDTDASGTINLSESEAAFLIFEKFLNEILSQLQLPPEEVHAFFTFMMRYGDNPLTMFGGSVAWLNWKWTKESWAYESNRPVLLGILNRLAQL